MDGVPISWYSKRQNTVESSSSTLESEFVTLRRTATAMCQSLPQKLRMFGIPIDGSSTTYVFFLIMRLLLKLVAQLYLDLAVIFHQYGIYARTLYIVSRCERGPQFLLPVALTILLFVSNGLIHRGQTIVLIFQEVWISGGDSWRSITIQ